MAHRFKEVKVLKEAKKGLQELHYLSVDTKTRFKEKNKRFYHYLQEAKHCQILFVPKCFKRTLFMFISKLGKNAYSYNR